MKNILVIAAHPDDETLGCGGTIAKHVSNGDKVSIIFLADGESSRLNSKKNDILIRKKMAMKALKILGVLDIYFLDFPDNKLDSIPQLEILQKVEKIFKNINPEIVYTHYFNDLNIDHRIANSITKVLCRPLENNFVKKLISYEVLSSTDWNFSENEHFSPNYFINITEFMDKKITAINSYTKEMHEIPNSRSVDHVKNLAKHRGATVGLHYAEAFYLIYEREN